MALPTPEAVARAVFTALAVACAACDDLLPGRRVRIESDDAELRAAAEAMLAPLERLSGLRATGPLRIARQPGAALRARMYERLDEMSPAEQDAIAAAYAMLGVLPDSFDLYALVRAQADAISGYYDPETDVLYIMDSVTPAETELVLSHELVHALQDQHVDLRPLLRGEDGEDDAAAAMRAAVEGHASLVMAALLIERVSGTQMDLAAMPSVADLLRRSVGGFTGGAAIAGAPRPLQVLFYFPYIEGSSFVWTLWRRRAEEPQAAIASLLPRSTEQVLHPERALLGGRDEPQPLRLEPPPAGWETCHEATLGEFTMRVILEENLGSSAAASANGWKGDRLRLIHDGAGRRVLQWATAWDDAAAADAFERTAARLVASRAPRWTGQVTRGRLAGMPLVYVTMSDGTADLDLLALPAARAELQPAAAGCGAAD